DLAAYGFAAGFEIHGLGEAPLRFGARLLVEKAEALGGRLGALVVAVDFALGCDAFAALTPRRRQRRASLHVGIVTGQHDDRFFARLPALDAFQWGTERIASEVKARGLHRKRVVQRDG